MFYASVGLIIVSVSMSHLYNNITGWLVFGAGMIVLSLLNELIDYARDRNLTREDAE
jgi:hypothetical protein